MPLKAKLMGRDGVPLVLTEVRSTNPESRDSGSGPADHSGGMTD
jgi:hypothetical protein